MTKFKYKMFNEKGEYQRFFKENKKMSEKNNNNPWYIIEDNYPSNNVDSPFEEEVVTITQTVPRTNMSGEIRTEGWLGSTNNVSTYARGEYRSLRDAQNYVKKNYPMYVFVKKESNWSSAGELEDDLIYKDKRYDWNIYTPEELLYDELRNQDSLPLTIEWDRKQYVIQSKKDSNIKKLEDAIEKTANKDKFYVNGLISSYLEGFIDDL